MFISVDIWLYMLRHMIKVPELHYKVLFSHVHVSQLVVPLCEGSKRFSTTHFFHCLKPCYDSKTNGRSEEATNDPQVHTTHEYV